MRALFSPGLKKISGLAITVLTLWLGGFGCALCCATGINDLCCAPGQNSCCEPASSLSDCCARAENQCASTTAYSISQPPDASCPLLPSQEPSLRSLSGAASLFAAALSVHQFAPKLGPDIAIALYDSSVPPANRGSTYLRFCTLLI
jgi:hypothetical protein